MNNPALMELAEHIALLTKIRDASKANGGVRSIDFGKASGDAFISALTAGIEALQLRTAAAEGGVKWFPLLGTPFAIRWNVLNESQAKKNHYQPLTRLAERGGLSPSEAIAVVEQRAYRNVAAKDAYAALLAACPPTDSGAGRDGTITNATEISSKLVDATPEKWPERFYCDGPEGSFWTNDAALANKMIGRTYDRDEWTVTDTQQFTAIAGAAGEQDRG